MITYVKGTGVPKPTADDGNGNPQNDAGNGATGILIKMKVEED